MSTGQLLDLLESTGREASSSDVPQLAQIGRRLGAQVEALRSSLLLPEAAEHADADGSSR
jgi:hypothetical protein